MKEKSGEKIQNIEELKKLAAQGDIDAMENIGDCYYKGQGVEQSYEKAFEWFKKAAELGNSFAMVKLGDCYYKGQGVEQSYEKAFEWYKKAAELGYNWAKKRIDDYFHNGKDMEESNEKSLAIMFGHHAQYPLLKFLNTPLAPKVIAWYEKLAEQEESNGNAKKILGDCYFHGKGVKHSLEKALDWYLKAADLGNPYAEETLPVFLDTPIVPKLIAWCEKVAEQEEIGGNGKPCKFKAQKLLGDCYYRTKLYEKAFEWYQKAAELGHCFAMERFGDCYYYGEGVEQSDENALECYLKAADMGGFVNFQLSKFLSTPLAPKVIAWYEKEAGPDYYANIRRNAQKVLGDCYFHGKGVEQSYEKALEWYQKAAELGDGFARKCITDYYTDGKASKIKIALMKIRDFFS